MEHDLELIRKGAVWVLFAFAAFATGMHAWLRLRAIGAEGMVGDSHAKTFTQPEALKLFRRAKLWRLTAAVSAIAAIAASAFRHL